MDEIDCRILACLQKDGRLTNLELAERVGLSPSPCLRRVRALEAEGVIAGYAARLDLLKVGLTVTAFVLVQLDRHGAVDAVTMRRTVLALPEVVGCYVMSGEFDLMLKVVARDLEDYRNFLLSRLLAVPGIRDTRTSFVIDSVLDAGPVPLRHLSTI